uniref:Uncharacterized protein n=1 Tax=Nelumbo nucifera TaxID=4432 RepID=A0A822ZGU6_NELNU|nr:TPA_asm: hypothetical protein HUJ06_002592 [Nelumbo nucifera]
MSSIDVYWLLDIKGGIKNNLLPLPCESITLKTLKNLLGLRPRTPIFCSVFPITSGTGLALSKIQFFHIN